MRALELQRDQLIASDDVVESQVAEMDVAIDQLGDGQFCMGEYHYSLLVFGDDVDDASRRAAARIGAVGESAACRCAGRPGRRRCLGSRRCRATGSGDRATPSCRRAPSPALAVASQLPPRQARRQPRGARRSPAAAPGSGQLFYPEPAQAALTGEDSGRQEAARQHAPHRLDGVGKTTLVMLPAGRDPESGTAAAAGPFDLDRGCEIALRALGGRYLTLEAGKPDRLQPAAARADSGRIQFWEQLLQHLHRNAGHAAAARRRTGHRRRCCRRWHDARAARGSRPCGRTLPKTARTASSSGSGRWCQGGALGLGVRPGRRRCSTACRTGIGFDTTEFLDLPEVGTPVMMYLLHRDGELVNGER
jgi:type IV secretion system protein VirB4